MSNLPLYLDYAATTPIDAQVFQEMADCMLLSGDFGNPASRSHLYGWKAEQRVELARKRVADLVNCDVREVVWTSGATEADNLAIKGVAEGSDASKHHIICSAIEHKAVLDTCAYLEEQGFRVTRIRPGVGGIVSPEQVEAALTDDTCLVSIMHVNNETGATQDLAAIGQLLKFHDACFHVDAAQSVGKLPIDLQALDVDLMSFSAHKIYGPKGVGALYVNRTSGVRVLPQIHGGGHERGMRSGTLPTHQLVGMGKAFDVARERQPLDLQHVTQLRETFLSVVLSSEGIGVNGDQTHQYPGIVNLHFDNVEGESMLLALNGMAISSGSACTSASVEPSFVLKAMGVDDARAHSSLRFSFGRPTSQMQVQEAAGKVLEAYRRLVN